MNTIQYILSPQEAHEAEQKWRVVKRSVDARQRELKVHLTVLVDEKGKPISLTPSLSQGEGEWRRYEPPQYKDVHNAEREVVIIGAGPAGLFAALTLIEHGIKPIIYERGKEVSERKKDIALLNRNEGLNPESNYCFGEGGAGTFSDGKLFSRSKKRGNMQRVMELFHFFGAPDTVLYEAHAHIGSDKLPTIIKNMRECILSHGGEIHFETKIESLKEVESQKSKVERHATPIILAIGHSAHDTYRMLVAEGVKLETKGFAMGVRAEHPQELINRLMYKSLPPTPPYKEGGNPHKTHPTKDAEKLIEYVGNASYSMVTQVDGRGVYSFCMCPGGHIVPAGSTADTCVVNGMSASHRNSPFANSGIVVQINPEDIPGDDPLRGLEYQEALEREAFKQGAYSHPLPGGRGANIAPAQRMKDFVEGKASKDLPKCSYLPGIVPSRLDQWLPAEIGQRLQQGFRDFDKKYPGFLTNDAVILGVESRSSSAVRIPRDPETLQSVSTPGLYPCGEGAGYAGGITSSALDGINAALKIADLAQ